MICAHDLFTNAKVDNGFPTGGILKRYKGLWKCQECDEEQLYNLGVRVFDCRIFWDDNCWRGCHGLANFRVTFNTLEDLCKHFDDLGKGDSIYRVILEKDNNNGESKFKNQSVGLCAKHPNLWTLLIRYKTKNWLNDEGMVDNNIDGLVSRGYNFAKLMAWERPNKEYNVPPPNFSLDSISQYSGFSIKSNAANGVTLNGEKHESNPNPTTWEMLTNKDYVYFLDYANLYIGNDRCLNFKEIYDKFDIDYKEKNLEIHEVATVSDLGNKMYKVPTKSELKEDPKIVINNEEKYKDNQLVFGSDISYNE